MQIEDRWMDRLSEYLDGELNPEERDGLEAHLDGCAACRATLTDLRRVSETARALPESELQADARLVLWSGIASRLAPRRRPWGERLAAALRPVRGRFSLSVPQLATAGVALVMVTAGITYIGSRIVARRHAEQPLVAQGTPRISVARPTTEESPTVETAEPRDETPPAAQVASFDEARYAAAVAELENTLQAHRSELDPATVRALEDNLAVIDEAVVEAKRALIADPGNSYLSGHLASQMHRKVRVLQRAAMIVAATR